MDALQQFTRIVAITVACFILAISTSDASTFIALDIDDLAMAADEVVVGTVVSSQAEPARGTIVTRFVVRVETSVSGGTTPADELEIVAAGGELDGIGVMVHGSPRLAVAQRYLLFLRNHQSEYTVVGLAQGALPIREERSNGELLVAPAENLPSLVRRNQGQIISSPSAITSPTRLDLVISRIREARHGL